MRSGRFVVSNGKTSRNGTLELTVEMVDRVLPSLTSNKGGTVSRGSSVVLGSDLLALSDPDTPPAALTFALVQPPLYGRLVLAGRALAAGARFTQADLQGEQLSYEHDGGPAQIDRFSFTAADGTGRGFLLDGRLQAEPVFFTVQVHDQVWCGVSFSPS